MNTFEVIDIDTAKRFLSDCINVLDMGMHPDTDFNDYITRAAGQDNWVATFTKEVADKLNTMMDQTFTQFDIAGECIYGYCIDLLKAWGKKNNVNVFDEEDEEDEEDEGNFDHSDKSIDYSDADCGL